LREYYLLTGREKRINKHHNRLRAPADWLVDSGRLVFMEENQWVVYWGVPACSQEKTDAAVFQGVNLHQKGIHWTLEQESCFVFLNVMAAWHASYGGAVANRAVGYVDGDLTRKTLDKDWTFVGEVNRMRAYRRGERAICFLPWKDRLRRNLPPWRVFAAAPTHAGLQSIQVELQAQWESWG
jgi:hypothetical protein